jgi:hypothetical protein
VDNVNAVSSTQAAKLLNDRLQNAQPDEPVELWIYSAFPKDNWVAHKAGDATHAEHPGTAIQLEGKLYEIMMSEETAEAGYAVRYGLKAWNPHHAVRQLFPYTPQARAQAAASYLDEVRRQQLRMRLLWLYPLAGLAPDPLLREWENKTHVKMIWSAVISAFLAILAAFTIRQLSGGSDNPTLALVMLYLVVGSLVRLLWIGFSGQPHGEFLLTLSYLLWEAVARPEKRAAGKQAQLKFSYEDDEVIRRPGSGVLIVRSMLFDDMLAGPAPVRFEGAVYKPLHWHLEGKGLQRRWVFELEKTETDPQGKFREYTQPRASERQKLVEAFTHRLDVAHSFALLWGTYPRKQQVRLQLLYQFPAARSTAITAGILLLVALLQGWASILLHKSLVALATPVYFFIESSYRLFRAKGQGEPAGSLVGYVFQLLVRPPC